VPGFILRTLASAFGLWLAAGLLDGIAFRDDVSLLFAALLLGFVNAVVRPILIVFTLPITVLTLGLFLWVVNAAMLGLVAAVLDGFTLQGLFPALMGSLIVGVTSAIASWMVGPSGRVEVMVTRRRTPRHPGG
jgi:putative membrane protein